MADYLIEFIEGQTIKASEHNSNNQYLLDQINDSIKTLNAKVSSIQSNLQTQLQNLYPVGAIYLGVTAECPLASLFGTWEKLPADRVLQTAGIWSPGTQVPQGLPDHNHQTTNFMVTNMGTGFAVLTANGNDALGGRTGNASATNSVYSQQHGRVQPYAYTLNAWRRIA